jgi:hypothetical protein
MVEVLVRITVAIASFIIIAAIAVTVSTFIITL